MSKAAIYFSDYLGLLADNRFILIFPVVLGRNAVCVFLKCELINFFFSDDLFLNCLPEFIVSILEDNICLIDIFYFV